MLFWFSGFYLFRFNCIYSYMPTPGYTPYFTGGQHNRHPQVQTSTGKQLLSTIKGYHGDTTAGDRTITQQSMLKSSTSAKGMAREGDNSK